MSRERIFVIAEREYFYAFKNKDGGLTQFLDKGKDFVFDAANYDESVKNLVKRMAEITSQEFTGKDDKKTALDFVLICDKNASYCSNMEKTLRKYTYVANVVDMKDIIPNLLQQENDVLTKEYGINFDGKSYISKNGKISRKEFNLLAKNIDAKKIILNLNL